MSGGRKSWQWDPDLPGDLVSTSTALKFLGRGFPNVLWHRRLTGRLRAYNLGHAVGWSLAELVVLLQEQNQLTNEEAMSRLTPWFISQVIDVRGVPPDPLSPEQARRTLGIGPSWFREQVSRGAIPYVTIAGQRVFSQKALLALLRPVR